MKISMIVFFAFMVGVYHFTFAQGPEKNEVNNKPENSIENSKAEREKMALAHEKMAACLRSEKTIRECREEMHNERRANMGKMKKLQKMENMGMNKGPLGVKEKTN